jgi:hypothetical protein
VTSILVWSKEFGGPEALVAGDAPEPMAGPVRMPVGVGLPTVTGRRDGDTISPL